MTNPPDRDLTVIPTGQLGDWAPPLVVSRSALSRLSPERADGLCAEVQPVIDWSEAIRDFSDELFET